MDRPAHLVLTALMEKRDVYLCHFNRAELENLVYNGKLHSI
jgi:hypothetical protein